MTRTDKPAAPGPDLHDVRLFGSFGELAQSAAPPDDTHSADLFFTTAWFDNLAAQGVDTRDPLVLASVSGAAGRFCLPLQQRNRSQAAAYGRSIASLSNYYSSLFGPIGDDAACTVAACSALLQRLRRDGVRCNVLDLQPLDDGSAFFANVQQALRQEGHWTDRYFCFGNWYLKVDGRSFDDCHARLPSQVRNTVRRGRKKLDAQGAWSLTVHQHPGSALDTAIDDFQTIYRHSWKQPEPYPQFIGGLCRTMAARGWLRLGVLRVGDAPAAAQIWMQRGATSLIFKLAYDERFKGLSAGSVLTAAMMRQAIDEDGVQVVDYLTGDDAYKADWMSHRRERIGLLAFRKRSLQGALSALRHFGGRWWRQRQQARAAAAARLPGAAGAAPAGPRLAEEQAST